MDEDIDDIDEIFGEYEAIIDEDEGQNNQNGQQSANAPNTDFPENVPAPTKKRIIKNPRLKFDPDRLCGPRGIPVLIDHFKDVKFKGKGHEIEDLDRLLSTLEHWTHRLYPSMKFEDTLHQIEKLGKKKPVQVCVQKIRMDMPILNSDFISTNEDVDDVAPNEAAETEEVTSAFDHLFEEHQRGTQPPADEPTDTPAAAQTSTMTLTEDQQLRMQRNRELAAERRRSRFEREAAIQQEQCKELNTGIAADDNDQPKNTPELSSDDDEDDSSRQEKPAKRLRVISDSDEDCDIDDLVQQSIIND